MPTPAEFRRNFPSLNELTYLASCSQGALSETVAAALQEYQDSLFEHGAAWERWETQVEHSRRHFARSINAAEHEIAVVPSLSAAAYQVVSTRDWTQRSRIVSTDLEFPSLGHVWLAQEPSVAYVEDRAGVVYAEDYTALLDESCGLVSIPLASYRNGVRLPVREVIEQARTFGVPTFVDAYQAAGVEPIDVQELECDFLAAGAMKYLLGVPGIAFLYVRDGVLDAHDPVATGWFGRQDPFAFDPRRLDYPDTARRFESGTPSIPAAYAAVAGLQLLESVDPKTVRNHIADLGQYCHDALTADGERIGSPADRSLRGAQVAVRDGAPGDLAKYLAERGIITSPRGDLLRIAFHYYSTSDDVEAVVRAIADYRRSR
ncbi:aminotransferase class V-fold PLP-dependent enzyme [Kribbella sandramycini]|uniref:Aminotransferase class V-fold PLP-dependent enzyme n=1 Tax=Kribbella sandramycini TaxID=60450 RepID=A0A7Y4NX94_9ACTN|nr:aminotransferase class V-fold PLP-dependent enzyme [Kribbella sandramycini]MBB6567757.1 selenocysteine lyase/cysteine desulfurase [Kribbella sandramycini]NOL39647.1 aminotransferase class V-fold PLP-dependent enzyme [Kribbella sandramycini]